MNTLRKIFNKSFALFEKLNVPIDFDPDVSLQNEDDRAKVYEKFMDSTKSFIKDYSFLEKHFNDLFKFENAIWNASFMNINHNDLFDKRFEKYKEHKFLLNMPIKDFLKIPFSFNMKEPLKFITTKWNWMCNPMVAWENMEKPAGNYVFLFKPSFIKNEVILYSFNRNAYQKIFLQALLEEDAVFAGYDLLEQIESEGIVVDEKVYEDIYELLTYHLTFTNVIKFDNSEVNESQLNLLEYEPGLKTAS